MTIPKKIHYCWLSGEPIPKDIQKCMQTWRDKMPDYELILWDKNKFDINSVDFVREACEAKKWASASDYIRAYALYTDGGIYLDTDVIVRKSFDEFLKYDFFTAIERALSNEKKTHKLDIRGIAIQAAILGGIKGHPYLRDVLSWYETHHFINSEYNIKHIAPNIYASVALKYGFKCKNQYQRLKKDNMLVLPAPLFAENLSTATQESYAVHCCKASWVHKDFLYFCRRNNLLRKIFKKRQFQRLDDVII